MGLGTLWGMCPLDVLVNGRGLCPRSFRKVRIHLAFGEPSYNQRAFDYHRWKADRPSGTVLRFGRSVFVTP